MTRKTLVEHMYPITCEAIHVGTVSGKERTVTKNSGIYGWHGDRSQHIVRLYDARGALTPSNFTTTVDRSSVRTDIRLEQDQAAVVVKVPVTIEAAGPVNVVMHGYDADAIRMVLNGEGKTEIRVTNSQFPIAEGRPYRLTIGDEARQVTAGQQGLIFPVSLDGPVAIEIAVEPPKP
jgi:N-acetyl-beta-hexosaminidase